MTKIFSVDAETDGLYGDAFAIAAVVYENGTEVDRFVGRANVTIQNEWVRTNVLPVIQDIPAEYDTVKDLQESFWAFWMKHNTAIVIAHGAYPVETGLFKTCVMNDMETRMWNGPMFFHEIAYLLLINNENSTSVSDFIQKHNLVVPFDGNYHNPLYDAIAAATVYHHLQKDA